MTPGPNILWPVERIVDACRAWADQHGAPPKARQWRNGNDTHPSDTTVCRRFGTWNAMLVAAGFAGRRRCGPPLWTYKTVLAACRGFAAEHGRAPLYREWLLATPGTPNSATVQRLFGTWNLMLVAAGLPARPATPPVRWTRETIANRMLDFVGAHGRWPTGRDWEKGGDHPKRSTVLDVFGTWSAAKRFAGWNGVRTRHLSSARRLAAVEPQLVTAPAMRRDFAASTSDREPDVAAVEEEVAA